jgi:hypothetical protein
MNKKEAVLCAMISRWAYGVEFKSDDFRLTARFENKATDTQGLFGIAYDNSFVIAFRGSEETGVADFITDIKFIQQVYPYEKSSNKKVKVHYGFIEAYKSVRDAVLTEAKKTTYQRIICTGHSLGAALATLCALDIQYNLPDKEVACYTYGSPKVGNKHFIESYNRRVPQTYRFVNKADLIPDIPPGNYRHVGRLQQLGQVGPDRKKKMASRVDDHFPHNYINSLRKLL